MVEEDEKRSMVLGRSWHPGSIAKKFQASFFDLFKGRETNVAKEIKAWCGEMKHEAY